MILNYTATIEILKDLLKDNLVGFIDKNRSSYRQAQIGHKMEKSINSYSPRVRYQRETTYANRLFKTFKW